MSYNRVIMSYICVLEVKNVFCLHQNFLTFIEGSQCSGHKRFNTSLRIDTGDNPVSTPPLLKRLLTAANPCSTA